MHPSYTQKDIGKLLKKSIKNRVIKNLSLTMAKNCDYKKEEIINTVIFSVS